MAFLDFISDSVLTLVHLDIFYWLMAAIILAAVIGTFLAILHGRR